MGAALQAASANGQLKMVQLLLQIHRTDIAHYLNIRGECFNPNGLVVILNFDQEDIMDQHCVLLAQMDTSKLLSCCLITEQSSRFMVGHQMSTKWLLTYE
jgi:hypothetical protein